MVRLGALVWASGLKQEPVTIMTDVEVVSSTGLFDMKGNSVGFYIAE